MRLFSNLVTFGLALAGCVASGCQTPSYGTVTRIQDPTLAQPVWTHPLEDTPEVNPFPFAITLEYAPGLIGPSESTGAAWADSEIRPAFSTSSGVLAKVLVSAETVTDSPAPHEIVTFTFEVPEGDPLYQTSTRGLCYYEVNRGSATEVRAEAQRRAASIGGALLLRRLDRDRDILEEAADVLGDFDP